MITQQIIEKAMKKAQSAQASVTQYESSDVTYENDKLKSSKSTQRTEIGLKVILNEKIGFSSATDIEDINGLVERALATAEFGKPAHYQFPGYLPASEVETYDENIRPLLKTEMIQTSQEMKEMVKAYNPEILVNSNIYKSVGQGEFANSNGAQFSDQATSLGINLSGQLVRGTDILYAGHGFDWKKRPIDHRDIAKRTIQYYQLAERIAPLQSGDMPVIFSPEGLRVLLLSLTMGVNGKNVLLGASPLVNKLGQSIAHTSFTLVDNPLIDYASQSSRYDAEGIPRQVTHIIEDGVLKNFLYDLDTAGRAGVKSTGHGVGCNPTNLLLKGGDISYEEMVKNTKQGLLVHEVMGLGQGNPLNGEFSVNVYLGYKIENGEIVGRVKDVMLAGNAFEAIRNITAISDKPEWSGGWLSGCYPYVQVGKLSVVAK